MFTKVNKQELHEMCIRVMIKNGETAENAEIIYENLLEDELQGKRGHGFNRMPMLLRSYSSGEIKKPVSVTVTGNKVTVDGNRNIGLVAVRKAVDAIIEASKTNSIVIAGVKGYENTTGAMGYYCRLLARAGLVSIITATCDASVAPYGSMESHLATNPVGIGFPFKNNPVVTDVATSASTYGSISLAYKNGQKIPEGQILTPEGMPTTDPADIIERHGPQLPLAGHKGYSLAMAFEILAGLIVGADSGKNGTGAGPDGAFIVAFRPDIFCTLEEYEHSMEVFVDEIRNAKPVPGSDKPVHIPGMYDEEAYEKAKASDEVEIMTEVYKEILAMDGREL